MSANIPNSPPPAASPDLQRTYVAKSEPARAAHAQVAQPEPEKLQPRPIEPPERLSGDAEHLRIASEQIQARLDAHGSKSQIAYDQDSGRFVIRITNAETGDVVLQIPSQDMLDLQKRLESLTGIVLDKQG